METYTYKRWLDLISESAAEYENQRKLYENKKKELYSIENKISGITTSINDLKNIVLSLDDSKEEAIEQSEIKFNEEVKVAKEALNKRISEINNSVAQDNIVEENINQEYSKKLSSVYENVANIEKQIKSTEKKLFNYKTESNKLELQINNTSLEENQIRLCAEEISCDYEEVANNTEFISDYRDPRGASPLDAQKKFNSLPAKKIKKIAEKLNSGAYVSSPDESKGFPISEILHMVSTTLWIILKGIFQGVSIFYKPVKRFYDFTHKVFYIFIITMLLLFLFIYVSDSLIDIIIVFAIGMICIFIGMILFNIIKYSNKTLRREWNLEYYTVGYYFTVKKEEILHKIASDYFSHLKANNPSELERILQSKIGVIAEKKYKVDLQLSEAQALLSKLYSDRDLAVNQYNVEKERLKEERIELINTTLEKLDKDRKNDLLEINKECENKIELSKAKKENTIANIRKNAVDTLEKSEKEILTNENQLKDVISKKEVILSCMKEIAMNANDALKKNNYIASEYKKQKIKIVEKRYENDQIPDTIVAGLRGTRLLNLESNEQETVYNKYELTHSKKPIILVCNIEDDESIVLTENYYSFIDSLIGDLLGRTYIGAFRFVIVDSQGNKSRIVNHMEICKDSFDNLERFDCVKIINDSTDKCFDNIIKEQESQLRGKTIDLVNESKKNLDNMVKYNFLCMRIYSKKTSDFSIGDFRKRIDSSLNNGIIPILIMSQNYFSEKKMDLEGTIKELCDNVYYDFDLTINTKNNIKEIKMLRKEL